VNHLRDVEVATARDLYLDLMKKCLTRSAFGETYHTLVPPKGTLVWALYAPARKIFSSRNLHLVRRLPQEMRENGQDWPIDAETMIGMKRLDNLQSCLVDVLVKGVAGDVIETGVWRGGATIFMRAILSAYGDETRQVWVADSFEGLPRPTRQAPDSDRRERLWAFPQLSVSLKEVKANFDRYSLLDERVRFLVGWFKDTLPSAPIEKLSVLRLDGDMYESTLVALESLYPKLSIGGYVIVDDYGNVPGCKKAVDEYRRSHGITDRLEPVDPCCVFWKRSD